MFRILRYVFLAFALLSALVGLGLFLSPGRVMSLFGWPNLDPILYRVLGGALVALGWSAFRGAQVQDARYAQPFVDVQVIFYALAAIGVWRHLLTGAFFASYVWLLAAFLSICAVIWVVFWVLLVIRPTASTRSGAPGIRVRQ